MNISHDYYDMIIDIINSVTDNDTWRHDGSELDGLRGRIIDRWQTRLFGARQV